MRRILEGVGSGVFRNEESYPDLARLVSKLKKEYGRPELKPAAKESRSSTRSRTKCRVHEMTVNTKLVDCQY